MQKNCAITGKKFVLTDADLQFFKKIGIAVPDIHPLELLRCAMSCRNERNLYHRTCDKTGKILISAYHAHVPFPVYQNEVWWSDSWEGLEYGRAFDFSRTLAAQFKDLQNVVPRDGTSVFRSENCDYNSHIRDSKHCYLCSLIYSCEDCYYCYWVGNDTKVVDSYFVLESELCYECLNCQKCYDCAALQESKNCNECYFSYHLQGCDHCIGCHNLAHKSYHINNAPVSPAEFAAAKKKYLNGTRKGFEGGKKILQDIRARNPHRAVFNLNCENVFGDNLRDCKNCYYCFLGDKSEDCRFCISLNSSKDVHSSYAVNVPNANELVFASSVVRGSNNIAYSYYIWNSNNLRYCDSCVSCQDCFACIGLKHKQYCILNKQYGKKEYFELLSRIEKYVKETGEGSALPTMLTSFAYNESAAQDYFPIDTVEAAKHGWTWFEEEESKDQYMGPPTKIPENLSETTEDVTKHIFLCEVTENPFKITQQELDFYKRMQVPLPRRCPNQRHKDRMQLRHPGTLWERKCEQCGKNTPSSYSPEHSEIIYCEDCYLSTIY